MILFDFEKMTILANAMNDPSMKEILSNSIEICALLFLIFFTGYLCGQVFPVAESLVNRLFDYLERKKGDSDDN